MKKDIKNAESFEEAIVRLEQIVNTLEAGKSGLDESLAAFEEGIALVKYCNEKLTQAEQKVRILIENGDGETEEADFSSDGV